MRTVPIELVRTRSETSAGWHNEPVTAGLPVPKGVLRDMSDVLLRDETGAPVPIQGRVLDRWSDGSVRWLLVDFLASIGLQAEGRYTLSVGTGASRDVTTDSSMARRGVAVVEAPGAIVVDTGAARFTTRVAGPFPFDAVQIRGTDAIDTARSGLQVRLSDGRELVSRVDRIEIEDRGPIRATLRWQGRLGTSQGQDVLEFDVRAHFSAGLPVARIALTIRNPRRAVHPGNFWELGDRGAVHLRNLSLVIALPATSPSSGGAPVEIRCSPDRTSPLSRFDQGFEIYQESSGGENWASLAHVNGSGRVPMRFKGYRLREGGRTHEGIRATPIVGLRSGRHAVATCAEYFWENFPRAIEVRDDTLRVGLWPEQYADAHELQGGEQKTHEFAVAFGEDDVSEMPLAWCRSPLLARVAPEWHADCEAVHRLVAPGNAPSDACQALVQSAIEGADSFFEKRERIDEYGWRHFGDIYADHEAVHHDGSPPLVSHYNNQYDAIEGFATQFLRSGDLRWWTQMRELAAHTTDIDIYHCAGDKPAYSGGAFWHTYHFTDAGRSTHRSYPRAAGVPGGGPSCEHDYSTGLMLHYFLTGETRSKDAAVGLAEWVLQIEDGSSTPFRWFDRGATGAATATRTFDYHGPGRGAANSITTLRNGYRLTGNPVYLERAEQFIRRCIHPADDIEDRHLLDAEQRWSYTVFLQALGRFLDDCVERGTFGPSYSWARESLLHYARWMSVHEYPYLEKPQLLEYPTETWAAQDVRKSEVFSYAAVHASLAQEQQVFRERAAFFFETSTATLLRMASRTLARPVVIMLSNGRLAPWIAAHPACAAPPPHDPSPDFGLPQRFVPQRIRAIRRAKIAAGIGVAIAGVLAGLLLFG